MLGFETDDAGHSAWAMVLRCTDLDWLRSRLREASYQSHCEDGTPRRLIIGEVIHSTEPPPGVVGGIDTANRETFVETDIEAIEQDACLVEGEDRSFR